MRKGLEESSVQKGPWTRPLATRKAAQLHGRLLRTEELGRPEQGRLLGWYAQRKLPALLGLPRVSHQSSAVLQFWVDETLQCLASGDPNFAAGEKAGIC